MKVPTVHLGDSREVLKTFPDASVDSVVTDPPYALVSIAKRFGGEAAAPAQEGATGVYARASAGFMGQQWDTGSTAFDSTFWREVWRVLKPGGHVVAFGGTRSYHRLACAIEDAGFEIRDMLAWLYGSGFPKSHDVSKAIDRRKDWSALPRLQQAVRDARKGIGISQTQAARNMGLIGPQDTLGGGGFMWFETGRRMPTRAQWPALKAALSMGDDFDACFTEAEREVTGEVAAWENRSNFAMTTKDGKRRDKPASAEALLWEGWGTALKPCLEPTCFARKPLIGTIAENVLTHGPGALHVAACRIAGLNSDAAGRWPGNVLHDGSPEVIAAFPDSAAAGVVSNRAAPKFGGVYGDFAGETERRSGFEDAGSVARFFYSAKADTEDRLGSDHPTIKPVDLMRWLVTLITPPGGVVLDPFAGTGTTGLAAAGAGFDSILIEREEGYVADIHRRLAWARGEGRPMAQEALRKSRKVEPLDGLFAGMESDEPT